MASRPKSVGSCTIEQTLGTGGMAEVFRGYQESLERWVAVKALLPEHEKNQDLVERFRREGLALATLQHENIIAVHDLVQKYNRYYMIMEYVDGVDLSVILRDGPLPIDIALIIGSALAGALEHAHFRKVIHRDVKPANIMISSAGQIKLMDFGIAKDQTKEDMTQEGFVVGTPNYFAPETLTGKQADWRSDIYAMGVLLFESLSGTRPFAADSQAKLLFAILKGKRKRLRECAPHLPRSVEKIIDRCMHLNPEKRYQRAAELRRALEKLLSIVLNGTPSARLVAFLKERGKASEADQTIMVDDIDVEASSIISDPMLALSRVQESAVEIEPPGVLRRLLHLSGLAFFVVLGLTIAGFLALILAPTETQELLTSLLSQLQSFRASW